MLTFGPLPTNDGEAPITPQKKMTYAEAVLKEMPSNTDVHNPYALTRAYGKIFSHGTFDEAAAGDILATLEDYESNADSSDGSQGTTVFGSFLDFDFNNKEFEEEIRSILARNTSFTTRVFHVIVSTARNRRIRYFMLLTVLDAACRYYQKHAASTNDLGALDKTFTEYDELNFKGKLLTNIVDVVRFGQILSQHAVGVDIMGATMAASADQFIEHRRKIRARQGR